MNPGAHTPGHSCGMLWGVPLRSAYLPDPDTPLSPTPSYCGCLCTSAILGRLGFLSRPPSLNPTTSQMSACIAFLREAFWALPPPDSIVPHTLPESPSFSLCDAWRITWVTVVIVCAEGGATDLGGAREFLKYIGLYWYFSQNQVLCSGQSRRPPAPGPHQTWTVLIMSLPHEDSSCVVLSRYVSLSPAEVRVTCLPFHYVLSCRSHMLTENYLSWIHC